MFCNGTIESIWFSSEVLNHNLFSNCKLSFFATFICSKFLIALLVEKPLHRGLSESNLILTIQKELAIERYHSRPTTYEGLRSFRYKVVSIQVDSIQIDSIQIEVVSKHVGSRFDSIQSSGPQQGEKQGGLEPPQKFSDLN